MPNTPTDHGTMDDMPSLYRARTVAVLACVGVLAGVLGNAGAGASSDPLFAQQWGLGQIKAPSAWSVATGAGVRIGIVDSGIDLHHPDLAGKIVASAACVDTTGASSQCVEGGEAAMDVEGHGSHVAGIAAAVTGNNTGGAGAAPGAQLVVARVFKASNGDVTGRLEDLQAGIRWVIAHGATVVNLSIGVDQTHLPILGTGSSKNPMFDIVEEAWKLGALPIVASGNSNAELFGGSASYGQLDAIIVAATGKTDRVASYSSPIGNAKWGLAAPGGDPVSNSDDANMILSTFYDVAKRQSAYAYMAGTSMATPFVSGTAAALFGQGLNRQQVVDTLLGTLDRSVNCDTGCKGRLDAAKAVGLHATSAPAPTAAPPTAAPPTRTPRPATATTPRVTAAPLTTPAPAVTSAPEVLAAPVTVAPTPGTTPSFGTTKPVIIASPPTPPVSTPTKTAGVVAFGVALGGLLVRRRSLTAAAAR